MIKLRRIYDPAESDDGIRILVERLWPRGLSKEKAAVDLWARDIAPSTELRKWYSHDPEKWGEFRDRYFQELKRNPDVQEILHIVEKNGNVTFLYASREREKNSATVLRDYIAELLR